MGPRIDRPNNVAAIELAHGKQIQCGGEKADPRGATDGMEHEVGGVGIGLKNSGHEFQDERHTEDYVGIGIEIQSGDDASMEYSVSQCGQSEEKAHQRTRGAHIEERATGTNGRADQNEGAESSDQGRSRNEKRIGGINVMMAAGEIMSEFMREKNGQKGKCERQPGQE